VSDLTLLDFWAGEMEVITMAMIGKIRRMRFRQKKSLREIARVTSLSRNTIRKWLRAPVQTEPKYRRRPQPTKLAAFQEKLVAALKADARRPKRERRTTRALYAELKALGYQGGYTRVTDFVRAWRHDAGQGAATSAFVPLCFELGEAFQLDWSEEGVVVGGEDDHGAAGSAHAPLPHRRDRQ
jgi:transposase